MSLLSLLLFAHQKSREGRAGRLQFLPLWWQEGGKEGTSRCRMHYEKKRREGGFSGCRFRAESEEGEREREKGGNGKTTAHTTHSYQPTFSRFFRGNVFFRAPENNCRRRRRFLLVSSPVILEEKRREPLSFFTHRGILSLLFFPLLLSSLFQPKVVFVVTSAQTHTQKKGKIMPFVIY